MPNWFARLTRTLEQLGLSERGPKVAGSSPMAWPRRSWHPTTRLLVESGGRLGAPPVPPQGTTTPGKSSPPTSAATLDEVRDDAERFRRPRPTGIAKLHQGAKPGRAETIELAPQRLRPPIAPGPCDRPGEGRRSSRRYPTHLLVGPLETTNWPSRSTTLPRRLRPARPAGPPPGRAKTRRMTSSSRRSTRMG